MTIKQWTYLPGLVIMALIMTACWPSIPDDASADPAVCGAPCDEDLGLDCATGFACVSGVCLNSAVCGSCGQSCDDAADCEAGWYCDQAVFALSGSPKYCWPGSQAVGGYNACTQVTEDYCGLPCEHGDPQIGGYSCWHGVLIATGDHSGCSTCGKDCTSDAQCGKATKCVQFPDYSGGTKGSCWNVDTCTAPALVIIDGDDIPQLSPTKTPTPPPTAPAINPNLVPVSTAKVPELCANNGGIANVSEICTCQGVIDRVTFCGDNTKFDNITDASCTPDASQCQPTTTDGGAATGGGECLCIMVCTLYDRAGACVERGYRDCNGNACTP
jgi:hypothetical protein